MDVFLVDSAHKCHTYGHGTDSGWMTLRDDHPGPSNVKFVRRTELVKGNPRF